MARTRWRTRWPTCRWISTRFLPPRLSPPKARGPPPPPILALAARGRNKLSVLRCCGLFFLRAASAGRAPFCLAVLSRNAAFRLVSARLVAWWCVLRVLRRCATWQVLYGNASCRSARTSGERTVPCPIQHAEPIRWCTMPATREGRLYSWLCGLGAEPAACWVLARVVCVTFAATRVVSVCPLRRSRQPATLCAHGLVHFNHGQSPGQILQVSPTLSDAVLCHGCWPRSFARARHPSPL